MLRAAYLCVIALATLSSLGFDPRVADALARIPRAIDPRLGLRDVVDGARNVALFAGLGVTWVLTAAPGPVRRSIAAAGVLGLALGAAVETVQLFSSIRTASILDVATNTVGALVGAAATAALLRWVAARRRHRSFVGVPGALFAGGYGVAVVMESFAPLLRQDRLPDPGGGVVARLDLALGAVTAASWLRLPIADVLIFAPAGMLGVAAAAEGGWTYGAAAVLVATVAAIVLPVVEVAHGIAGSAIVPGAVLVHVAAIGLGAWGAAVGLPRATRAARGPARPAWLLAGYAAVLACWSWRPFVPVSSAAAVAAQFSAEHWIPLRALAGRVDLFSVADVVAQFALYFPLGALLAVWPLRPRGALRGMAPAAWVAVVLELGKMLVAGRFFDITHILIQIAGAGAGAALARRAGYAPHGAVLVSTRS